MNYSNYCLAQENRVKKMQGNRNYDTQLPTHTNLTMPCAMCKCNIRVHTRN